MFFPFSGIFFSQSPPFLNIPSHFRISVSLVTQFFHNYPFYRPSLFLSNNNREKEGEKGIRIDGRGFKKPMPFTNTDSEQFATESVSPSLSSLSDPISQDVEQVGRNRGSLTKHLRSMISISGPITIATYMKECLTHPTLGYYMRERSVSTSSPFSSSEIEKSDIFGAKGDFITSPEVHQMFGETIAVLYVDCWIRLNRPRINLIEVCLFLFSPLCNLIIMKSIQ